MAGQTSKLFDPFGITDKFSVLSEQEACRRITKKLEKKSIFTPDVNARYIGKQNPNRFYLGRYGGDKITDTTYKAAVDRLWYREPSHTSYFLK